MPNNNCAVKLPNGFSTELTPPLSWQHFDSIDSTNAYLLDKNQSANQLISTYQQTHGRGRRQQKWVDEGQSALFSLSTAFDAGTNISAWPVQVALTLAESLNSLLANDVHQDILPLVQIKWPNDLYIANQNQWGKCAGILVESTIGATGKVVTGVGINLSPIQSDITSDYRTGYITLTMQKKELIVILSNRLFQAWEQFVQQPYVDTKAYQYVDRLFGQGIIATDLHTDKQQCGIGAGINEQGHLLLRQSDNTIALTAQQRIRLAND